MSEGGPLYHNLYEIIGEILAENGETRTLTLLRLSQNIIRKSLSGISEPLIFEYDAKNWEPEGDYHIDISINDDGGFISYGDGQETAFSKENRYRYPGDDIYRVKLYRVDADIIHVGMGVDTTDRITNFITLGNIGIINLHNMFSHSNFNGKISPNFNTSGVKNTRSMFENNSSFNQKIGHWDVSKVTDMSEMFGNTNFNQPIGNWDVSNVTDMNNMFVCAYKFNQPIGNWDVSNVENMRGMFYDADKFNQPIGDWNVSKVRNMGYMFYRASQFNQSIGDWNVSRVKNMDNMFNGATRFNQPIGDWNVSRVRNMDYMFNGARQFNQPIKWKTPKLTDARYMFNYMISFRQSVEIDLPNLSMINELSGHSEMDERRVRLTIFPK